MNGKEVKVDLDKTKGMVLETYLSKINNLLTKELNGGSLTPDEKELVNVFKSYFPAIFNSIKEQTVFATPKRSYAMSTIGPATSYRITGDLDLRMIPWNDRFISYFKY